jgi:hypothetical protein
MAIEFTVKLKNQPGMLARLGGVLGDAGINIDAVHQMSFGPESIVQFVPANVDAAARALSEAGIAYTGREVLVVNILDEPGTLGDVAMVMADAGINIDSVYVMTDGGVVLGVDDLPGAMQVAGGMAVAVS